MFTSIFSNGSKIGTHRSFSTWIRPIPVADPKLFEVTEENQYDLLRQVVTPLSDMPYLDQLELKQTWINSLLAEYKTRLQSVCEKVALKVPSYKPKLDNICPSPVLEKYRNKDTFVLGTGIDGNPKTVGFLLGKPRDGKRICVSPKDLIVIRSSHYNLVKAFQEFVRLSALPACLKLNDGGFWRELRVRSNDSGHVMATVIVHPQNLTNAELQEQHQNVHQYFINGPGAACQLHSLYFQACPHSYGAHRDFPFHLLHGEKYLQESLCGRTFHISPESFFQVNTKMAEILYERVISVAKLNSQSTLLDLCCGTGTISILAAPFVRGTAGIDVSEEAINNAIYNAARNNIYTSNFIAGRVERCIGKVLEDLDASPNIVAVLNPGRGGVDHRMVQKLRSIPQICRLIYISCQADNAVVIRNIIELISPSKKGSSGSPFHIKRVMPLDMFPHTAHCEVIFCFERN